MYEINYILIFGSILSIFLSAYIFFRRDIDSRKISVVLILVLVFLTEIIFFIVTETLGYERSRLWFYVFITLFIYAQYFLFFYFFESFFKNIYIKILYPLFIFIFTIFLFLLFIGSFEAMYNNIVFNFSTESNLASINNITISLMFIWLLLTVMSFIMKRYYFAVLAILFMATNILSMFATANLLPATITLYAILILYSPFGIAADFLRHNKYSIYQQYDSDTVLNSFPFGVLLINRNGKITANKFLMTIFNNEATSPQVWFKEHKSALTSLEYDSFSSLEMNIGRREYHLYIQRIKINNYFHNPDLFVIFNYTNIQVLEKMSKEYTNFVVTSLMDKIYQYNVQIQYNQMFEFLRGFAHNSFSMISVIKAGFEYLIDGVDSFETILFTTKNMAKMKEQLVEKFNLMEKTLNLTNVGVAKLMDSFKILNNKIRFEFLTEST
ncbi:TPA: hypothetical protein DCW38_05480, partial [candidate division WOR-3 bacterium]|nr:hypothetical protein [candidate division WOR-3 bacterium]